jgi:hypothetical protein
MKKSLSLAGFALLAFSAFAQVQATKCQCSYFMPFFWEFSYPGMFQAQIDPATETMTITPLGNSFKGVVSIAVFESINCGDEPVCAYDFDAPVSGPVQLPEGFMPCALDASPLFLKLCWRRRVEFPSLQMAVVAW